jgi:tetratricopeptide (TPR) repeat protein
MNALEAQLAAGLRDMRRGAVRSVRRAAADAGGWIQRWRVPVVCLVLAAITFAVFVQTTSFEFIHFDDKEYVYDNPMVARGLTLKGIVWAFTSTHASNWHPLAWLSHMLDCQLYGLQPGGHHLTNVLLHTATVIVLFLVLRKMTGAFWRSMFVAAVFAIHPLRVESVAWVAERKDVLSGLFFMLTIGAYVRYARGPWSLARYGLVVLLFAMGLMCKPMLVTLPVVLLLLDYWPLQRTEPGKLPALVLEKLPLLALSAGSCVATLIAQSKAIQSTASLPIPLRFGNALAACMIYLGQMVYPARLALLYPFPRNGLAGWKVGLAAALVAGFSAIAIRQRRKQPWLLTGWLWYLVMLLPVVGIIQVGDQAHADRYTYLPQIGIYVAITWQIAAWGVKRQIGRKTCGWLMTGVAGALMVCAWQQTAYWKDGETLWAHTLDHTTDNYVAHYNLGNEFLEKGSPREAMTQYQEALQIKSDYAPALINLGSALLQIDRADEAISHLQRALQINPAISAAYNNLGNAFEQKGSWTEAISHFQRALQLDPKDRWVGNNLAWLLATCPEASLRNGKKAVDLATQVGELAGGDDPLFLRTLAAAYAEAGRFPKAVETAQLALFLAEAQSKTGLTNLLQPELKLYQAGSPFHSPEKTR